MVHGVSRTVKFTEIYSAKESEGESEQREMGEKGERIEERMNMGRLT